LKNGGSFWMMINLIIKLVVGKATFKNMVVGLPGTISNMIFFWWERNEIHFFELTSHEIPPKD